MYALVLNIHCASVDNRIFPSAHKGKGDFSRAGIASGIVGENN